MCEETEWTDVALIVNNITCLFDVYFYLLSSTDPQWKELRYKAEMTVLSIIGEVSAIQLLPSLLLLECSRWWQRFSASIRSSTSAKR